MLSLQTETPLTALEKRIANELSLLHRRYDNVSISHDKRGNSVVNIFHQSKNYSITTDSSYPFKPPTKILINKISVKKLCSIEGSRFSNYLIEYYGAKCICCNSVLLNNNMWSPALRFGDLVDEVGKIYLVKKKILTRILCNGIRDKYKCLIEFAPFEKYLFETPRGPLVQLCSV
jgi:hypothetical protein